MLTVSDLVVAYPNGRVAVDGVSLQVGAGETLGLVGESGSGKSTTARAIVGLAPVRSGAIAVDGVDVVGARGERARRLRQTVQLVFQNPLLSLNPRMTIGQTVREAVGCAPPSPGLVAAAEAERLLGLVGLPPGVSDRYPHQFSGGQLQRVALARALAVRPQLLILDEVTAALDVSIQATVLNLIRRLQRELGLALLYISHDLSVVRYMASSVAVMRAGAIVESGPTQALYDAPEHPYTQALLAAIPTLDRAVAS
ncbi:ATP-binding cassette domain-containing protein [Conexibacter stalactiti]|uniref:ATP-binding cassette domain-containing protein n=1 Tax=Conexibacter stalactiti TaxID=1940611 RepID=A0ABU4I113_9ACTN|nr:ATP-binding cassette domain-containing protein [Conexibacter stalactiti]MDW5598430.1 ATP-binding cassette domain-containing protein [Conexibacter stalactiti]MEC5039072.1 ATP-binding cassette domain-containing protein [Conexibacter stalactiti]